MIVCYIHEFLCLLYLRIGFQNGVVRVLETILVSAFNSYNIMFSEVRIIFWDILYDISMFTRRVMKIWVNYNNFPKYWLQVSVQEMICN